MPQYEYKFVRLDRAQLWPAKGLPTDAPPTYWEVIRQHAAEGWRFIQSVGPGLCAYDQHKFLDLIFERDVK